MIRLYVPTLSLCSISVAATSIVILGLTGCALESSAGPAPSSAGVLQGTMMGGETPIVGANIILWETDNTNSGYGLTAKQLATTTTAANGAFSITSNYTCDSGQFLYLTGTGGDVTNGSASPIYNLNEVQMVALGSCANFGTSTAKANVNILLNEVSTVAAAYTLDNFMSVTGSSTGHQLVYVGAPAANNATTGACTGTGSSMSCVAAGLSHAFANALNLTDSVHFNGTTPSGLALQTIPGNSQASVPQAQIHMLANAMQYCTNSAGGAAPAGVSDGTNCGNFFAAAAPSSSNVPTDTLSAMVDIAQNPRHNPATIYGYVPATGAAFQPTLSAAPENTGVPVTYTGNFVGTSSTLVYPSFLTLDANDNVYIIATNAASSAATTGGVVAMTSSGQYLWANAQSAQYCSTGALATDTVGNVWMVNGPTSSTAINGCWYGVTGFATSNGAVTNSFSPFVSVDGSPVDTVHNVQSQALEIAVDRLNDVWYARKSTSCGTCLVEFPYIAGTPATWGGATTTGTGASGVGAEQAGIVNANQFLFDAGGNLYLSNSGTATTEYVLPNTGTANASTYAAQVTGTFQGLTLAQGAAGNGITAFDGAGNLWTSITQSLVEFTPPFTNNETGTTTKIQSYSNANSSTPSITNPTTPYWGQVDGNGTLWYPSRTSSGQIWYSQLSNLTNSDYLYPCYAAAGATACAASATTTNETRMVQLDSTGAVWIVGQNAGYVTQLFGPGGPTWPQLSYAVYGTRPH